MRAIKALAVTTFLGSYRAKVFLYVLMVGIGMMLLSIPAADLSFSDRTRMMTDMTVGTASFLGIFRALFFGVGSVSGEVENRTVYNIISKPFTRTEFVLAKFFGVWTTIIVYLAASYVVIESVVFFRTGSFQFNLLQNLFYSIFEMCLLISLAIFFSCFSKPVFASVMTFMCYLIGTQTDMLSYWVLKEADAMTFYSIILSWMIPNFQLFDIKSSIAYHHPITMEQNLGMIAYALLYSAFLLTLSSYILHKRDLK